MSKQKPTWHSKLAVSLFRSRAHLKCGLAIVLCAGGSPVAAQQTVVDQSIKDLQQINLQRLTPESLVKEVSHRNASAIYEQLQWQLAERQVDIERAIFEPEFILSIMHQDLDTPNSVDEALSRSFQAHYEEESQRLSTGVKGRAITGAEWSVVYKIQGTESNVIDQFATYDREHRNTMQLVVRQPLLRDFGIGTTVAKRKVAEFAEEIAFLTYRLRLMEISGNAIQAYWSYYRAQENLRSWQESVGISDKLFRDANARLRNGLGAQTDVLEAETAVAGRTARLLSAQADLVEARNKILSLLDVTAEASPDLQVIAAVTPDQQKIAVPVFEQSLEKALGSWPPFLVALQKVDSEKVQVKYARNQTLPRLDVAMGYDVVGLDAKFEDAVDKSLGGPSDSWYVGLEFSMPVLGNQQARGALAQSRIRERQAVLELNSVRKSLSNSLHSKLVRVRHAEEQLAHHRRDVELKRRLRDAEVDMVAKGRSSVRELFRQEEDLIDYQNRYLDAVVELKLAEAALDIAEGNLLTKYGIEIQRAEAAQKIGVGAGGLAAGE